MGERGEPLCTKGSEQALNAMFGCLKPRGHVVSLRKNWSWWQLKVKAALFIRSCSRALVPAQRVSHHLNSVCVVIVVQDCAQLTVVVFGHLTKKKKDTPSISQTEALCHHFFLLLLIQRRVFVDFMDLSANGLPSYYPSHIWPLQPGPSRPPSFPLSPPLAQSGWSEPAAGEGGGSSAHRLVLFTLLTGVLLSSLMISVDITSSQHTVDLRAMSLLDGSINSQVFMCNMT